MESVSVFSLLLLFSVVGAVELQDNDILQQHSFSAPDQPQPCPPDIHSVLRDMSAALAEHRVRIEQLQTLNQAQAVKLGELGKQTSDQLQAQTAKLEKQTSEVDTLKQQLQAQATELNSIRQWTNVTDIQVEALKKDKAVGQVAFTATLLASGSGRVGPYNTQTPLVYRKVLSNIGNAYSPNTGFFIAPVRGAYHFELYTCGPGGTHSSGAALVKNGEQIFLSYEDHQNIYGTAANGATLLLEAGDVVFVRLWYNTVLYDNENRHNMFSGHLLFTM